MKLLNLFKTKEATKLPSEMAGEAGVSGDIVFSGFDNEVERPDKLKIKDYRKMRDTDATVESLLNVVTLPILSTTFGVKAAEDDENEEQADFIRACLFEQPYLGGMEIPFSLILEQMLHAIMDGFEVFERVYKLDENGRIVLKKLALRDATTIKIRVDDKGGYDGVNQKANFGLTQVNVNIPAHKTFLFTYGKADSPYYGRSAFKPLYGNWDKKRKLEYLDSIAIQNSAVKPKVLKRTSNDTITGGGSNDTKNILRKLAALGHLKPAASIPYGYDVTELQGGDNQRINESIERQNSEMARAFLATFSLLGSQGSSSVGSYALSADQSDLFMISLKGTMNLIVDHINQYWIADLIDLNFPVGNRHYPEFYFDDLTDDTIQFLKGIFTKLIEKDKISDDIVAGIEEKIKSRFEIEPIERETPENTPDEPETKPETPETNEEVKADEKKEGNGSNASKFRREMSVWEEKVNWNSLEKQRDKIEDGFEKVATPILEDYIKSVAENPKQKIELPADYVKAVKEYYGKSYNYGKLSASDEENKPAPKTKDDEIENTDDFVDFIVKDQTESIKELIVDANTSEASEMAEFSPKAFVTAGLDWVKQAIDGTKSAIFGNGNDAGRRAAFKVFDEDEDAVYMWSALLENTCAICSGLDGRVFSRKQMEKSDYQPGEVHLNCNCIWVRMTGEGKPTEIDGLPDNIDDLSHLVTTKKADLKKEGLVKDGETKKNAIQRNQFNEVSHGDTLKSVEDGIRDEDVEYFAAFDKNGAKLSERTDLEVASVGVPDDLQDYLIKNDVSVVTHNHPGSNAFSFDDARIASLLDVDEIRAVSKLYDYSLKKGEDGWANLSYEDVKDLRDFYGKKAALELKVKIKHMGKMSDDDISRWLTNRAMEMFAKDFGLIYNRKEV